jgi:hypothetical protein
MSKVRLTMASSVLAVLLFGCPKDKAADKPAQPKPATAQPPQAQTGLPATAGQGKMMHCPSTVQGADTAIVDTPEAIVVTVTAQNNEQAVTEIRSRAKHLAEVSVKNPGEVKHDGEGDGGGGLGNCPIVLADTAITAEDVPNGSKLTVKPSKAEDLPKLKQAANDRKAKLGGGAPAAKP